MMTHRKTEAFVFADSDSGGVIHVANIKGGVGKSTVATNLASALSRKGPTLLIDLDAQGSATHALGRDPEEFTASSWELFAKRFAPGSDGAGSAAAAASGLGRLRRWVGAAEAHLFAGIVGKGDVATLRVLIHPCLDLIPANSSLFHHVKHYHLRNFLFNLEICRNYYKYVVLDTPSVWNKVTRALYCFSDLNLIPVTLSALSTKSLREYLVSVKRLSARHPHMRVRIVKNEVFGSSDSKLKGKTRTMGENRKFLDSLCEQVVIRSAGGASFLPQTIMFDLEIPESSSLRDAQDEGKPVRFFKQYSAVAKAFDELANRVQYVLNTRSHRRRANVYDQFLQMRSPLLRAAAVLVVVCLLGMNPPVANVSPPRPVAPQQLASSSDGFLTYALDGGSSLYKMAKYAICYFRAVVPSHGDINAYVWETVAIHNRTRLPGETRIDNADRVPRGVEITFYPPANLQNPWERQLLPVYHFFVSLVGDSFAYVTGDWCERGTGGGTPHFGIDVAAVRGSSIYSPIDGTVYCHESRDGGRMMGIVREGMVLFFCHMDKRSVKSGATVRKGDILGTVGMTGNTSGPHAHVGYGIKSPGPEGAVFGKFHYRLTDPKLFFYRQVYVDRLDKEDRAE